MYGINYDEFSFNTTKSGKCCFHRIRCDKTVELLSRLKHSKYFVGKRKLKFEDDYNDLDEAIKDYEKPNR